MTRALMLVSAFASSELRADVQAGHRPRPEYLVLEREHGVELLDWTLLGERGGGRSPSRSVRHAAAALRRGRSTDVFFSDGEHVGIPLALGLRALKDPAPHLVIGHHPVTRSKLLLWRAGAAGGFNRMVVHSAHLQKVIQRRLRLGPERLRTLPYSVDLDFWRPGNLPEEALIASTGREHRDFATLAAACAGLPQQVFLARGSVHSPRASSSAPDRWPANFEVRPLGYQALRDLYARASVVVVPVLPADFPAGVTTLLEAMAMGKPVIATATEGLREYVRDGETGVLVPPSDAQALRSAISRLAADPAMRRRLGANAREEAKRRFGVERYAEALATQLSETARPSPMPAGDAL